MSDAAQANRWEDVLAKALKENEARWKPIVDRLVSYQQQHEDVEVWTRNAIEALRVTVSELQGEVAMLKAKIAQMTADE